MFDIKSTCGFTGHRPNKGLNGFNMFDNAKIIMRGRDHISNAYVSGYNTFISGMALGWDTWMALSVLSLKEQGLDIKLVCAIPCANQESRWKPEDQQKYHDILSKADQVIYVSDKPYNHSCMHERDEFIVNNSNRLICAWNGKYNTGTGYTVKYAESQDRELIILNPADYK